MEVVNNNQKLRVYWMYNDSLFPILFGRIGFSEEECEKMRRLPLKKQMQYWDEKVPTNPIGEGGHDACPDTTWCFLLGGDGKVIAEASVVRYHKDPEDRDKARKYALAKLLKTLTFSKEERKRFWDSYLTRGVLATPVANIHPVGE